MKKTMITMLVLLAVVVTGAWADTYTVQFKVNNKTVTKTDVTLPYTFSCDYESENGELDLIIRELYGLSYGYCDNDANPPSASGNANVTAGNNGSQYITISAPFAGTATVTGSYMSHDGSYYNQQNVSYNIEISIPGYVAPPTYTVSMKEDTEDAAKWQAKAGQGQYQQLPLSGVEAGTVVILKYDGRKKVRGVKAVKKAAAAPAGTDLSMVDCAGNARASQWTANCYMVHTAGDYYLPLVYGNAIKNGETNTAAYTGVENSNTTLTFPRHDGEAITAPWIKDNGIAVTQAELLWQDAQGLVTAVGIDGDYLTLTVGKDAATQEGNALVAAKDAEGTIVWSWHIWVTKQTFATLTKVSTGNHDYQVTPVNLGWVGDAVSQGYNTYYQWGRKDAFIPSTGTDNTNRTVYGIDDKAVTGIIHSTTTVDIDGNIKNPTTFYNISSKPNNSTAYNLWDAKQTGSGENIATATVKTVYDPSPAGFCVPTGNLYYYIKNGSGVSFTWDGNNKGRNLTVTPNVFFPASGLRGYGNGSLSNVGSYGYFWSASASNSSSGHYLIFDSSGWYWNNYGRASGFPVRAVAE